VSLTLHGIGISKGIAIGKVYILNYDQLEISQNTLSKHELDKEIARFQHALSVARQQLQHLRTQVPKNTPIDIDAFLEAHLLMLDDSMLTRVPLELIQLHQCNAEWALKIQCDSIVQVFEQMEDTYLSARKNDIEQVVIRVQRILRGYSDTTIDSAKSFANTIVLAKDLSPAEVMLLQHYGVLAFLTDCGGATSHTAILARSLGIPAIVGLRRARSYLRLNDTLIMDSFQGVVIVAPEEACLHYYQERQKEEKRQRAALSKLKSAPVVTLDGTPIILHVNIEFPEDMEIVKQVGGEGVGLYRTEFLFLNREHPPDEEEHLDAYLRVIRSLKGGPVIIRTLDLGADKQLDGKRPERQSLAANPALGLRAIRLCLKENIKLFKPQLRAILRASAQGQVQIMIPLVSGIQELVQVRRLLVEVSEELNRKSLKFDPHIPLGAMVEVPSMAICVDLFAPYVDFLSIGTNDLIQYTLALDRTDGTVNYLYDPLHPAVLRLVKMSIDAANKAAKPISMCGEMASDSRYVRLLLGLGLRSFSVHPSALLEIKQIINNSDITGLARLTNKILKTGSPLEILELLETING
jgi:phosphotransferase system enzyme I (PtsI)